MYIKITDNCPCQCVHCCFDAKPRGGRRMSEEMFTQALFFSSLFDDGTLLTLGGGEPLGHPLFFKFLNRVRERDMTATVITSGYYSAQTMRLARMIEKQGTEHVSMYISRDEYHPSVSSDVLQLVRRLERLRHPYMANYVNRGKRIIAQGRGADCAGSVPGCCCSDVMVLPTGDVYLCGCMKTCLGNIQSLSKSQLKDLAARVWAFRDNFENDCERSPRVEEVAANG